MWDLSPQYGTVCGLGQQDVTALDVAATAGTSSAGDADTMVARSDDGSSDGDGTAAESGNSRKRNYEGRTLRSEARPQNVTALDAAATAGTSRTGDADMMVARSDDDGSDGGGAHGAEAETAAGDDSEHERDSAPAMVGDKFAPKKGRAGKKRMRTEGASGAGSDHGTQGSGAAGERVSGKRKRAAGRWASEGLPLAKQIAAGRRTLCRVTGGTADELCEDNILETERRGSRRKRAAAEAFDDGG